MENTIYMEKYDFVFKKEFLDKTNRINNSRFEYKSNVYLTDFKEEKDKKDFEVIHLLEENIQVKRNNISVGFPDIFMFEIFSSLILYLDTEIYYVKALNKENILYRLGIIEEACKNKYQLRQEIKEIREIIEDENDDKLFAGLNNSALIRCLFGNPYFRNEKFESTERIFYLNNFINNIEIPVKIKEISENQKIKIIGEIEKIQMSNNNFIEKINEKYSLNVKDCRFFYNLDMEMEDDKVKNILIKINLKLDEKYEISEISELRGVK